MQKTVRPSYTRLAAAIVVPLSIIVLVYYLTDGKLGDMGGQALRLTVEAPSNVDLNAEGPTPLSLELTLTNRTGETAELSAEDPCKVLRWVVQAPDDVFVQAKGQDCVPDETNRRLASGEVIARAEGIGLDSRRYKPGVTYTVFVQFYGQGATAEFRIAD